MRRKTHDEYIAQVSDLGSGIRVLDLYLGTNTPIRHQCILSHVWWTKPDHILNSGSGCPTCAYKSNGEKISLRQKGQVSNRRKSPDEYVRQVAEFHGDRIIVLDTYTTSFNRIRHQCTRCNFIWKASPDNVVNSSKTGCPRCATGRRHSLKAIRWIKDEARLRGIRIRHAENWGEYTIPGTKLRVDGFHKPTNTIFEFYGDCFHGNPRLYTPRQMCHPFTTETASSLYKRTVAREDFLISLGYNIVSIWESDYDCSC